MAVSGRGTPRAKPGDTCIQIWELGANGQLDAPLGSLDDTLLGSGGTDAAGNFVAADGSFGIPVAPPLRVGQRLVAIDACADRVSAVVVVITVAAPLLGGPPLLAVAGLLLLLGTATLRRRADRIAR